MTSFLLFSEKITNQIWKFSSIIAKAPNKNKNKKVSRFFLFNFVFVVVGSGFVIDYIFRTPLTWFNIQNQISDKHTTQTQVVAASKKK